METARGLPNEAEVRRNLAGTVSSVDHRLRDLLHGYQVLFGVDYKLTEALSVELRGTLDGPVGIHRPRRL